MRKWFGGMVFAVLLFAGAEARAWRPSGWVWFQHPYAFDYQESRWYYLNPGEVQHCYEYASGTWSQIGENAITAGWSYFQCPYVYALSTSSWFYMDTGSSLYCFAFNSGEWSLLGSDWEPGRHIGPVFLGNSYAVVKAKLGAATEVRRTGDPGDYTLWTDYDALRLAMSYRDDNGDGVLNDEEQVKGIFANNFLNAPQWNYRGLTFGAVQETARTLFGQEDGLSTGGLLIWRAHGVDIFFDVGRFELSNIFVYQAD